MFCEKCGKKLPDNSNFCSNCGNNTVANETSIYQPQKSNGISMGKIIFLILGLIGTVYSLAVIIKDTTSTWARYTYTPPWTEHETGMILMISISVIVLIISLYSMFGKKN